MAEPKSHQRPKARGESESPRQVRFLCATPFRRQGDHDEVYFRDYLIEHPEVAREYEVLKLGLWKRFEHDRDGYTQAKTDFVQRYTQKAKGFPAPCLDIWQECDKM